VSRTTLTSCGDARALPSQPHQPALQPAFSGTLAKARAEFFPHLVELLIQLPDALEQRDVHQCGDRLPALVMITFPLRY